MISFLFLAYLLGRKIFFNDTMVGYTSLMGLMALSLGVTTTSMGLIGIYLGKVFSQVQNRPTYIIKDIYGRAPLSHLHSDPVQRQGEDVKWNY